MKFWWNESKCQWANISNFWISKYVWIKNKIRKTFCRPASQAIIRTFSVRAAHLTFCTTQSESYCIQFRPCNAPGLCVYPSMYWPLFYLLLIYTSHSHRLQIELNNKIRARQNSFVFCTYTNETMSFKHINACREGSAPTARRPQYVQVGRMWYKLILGGFSRFRHNLRRFCLRKKNFGFEVAVAPYIEYSPALETTLVVTYLFESRPLRVVTKFKATCIYMQAKSVLVRFLYNIS